MALTMKLLDLYYNKAYRRAGDETAVGWHRDEPPALLRKAVESLDGRALALDIGCGTGVNAVFMAQRGLDVTALDYVPEALSFASARAERCGVKIEFICADVTKFETVDKFDLILDSGCFSRIRREDEIEVPREADGLVTEWGAICPDSFRQTSRV